MVSILSIIQSYNGTLNLNRIGTNPLEHTFGAIRMKSRYRNTYEKMLKTVGKIELYKRITRNLKIGSKISGRRTYYGRNINAMIEKRSIVFHMDPRDIAVALHAFYGLPVTAMEIECYNILHLVTSSCTIVNSFYNTLLNIERRLHPMKMIKRINSHDVSLKCGRTREERIKQGHLIK